MEKYNNLMEDIAEKLREDYDIEPCTDDSEINLEEITIKVQNTLNKYDDNYWDVIHMVIEQYLKGINN